MNLYAYIRKLAYFSSWIVLFTLLLVREAKSVPASSALRRYPIRRYLYMGDASPFQPEITETTGPLGVVLLAGGKGTRMGAAMPKQFLPVLGRPILLRSLDIFTNMNKTLVNSIVVVLDEQYRAHYAEFVLADPRVSWADPGSERQKSVLNGLKALPMMCEMVAVHDAARPLVTADEVTRCVADARIYGAAVLGVPVKSTVKEATPTGFVSRTLPRDGLWEVHTPQVARRGLFMQGFDKVSSEGLEVTDDVSVVEALGLPVRITRGEYANIKLTTPGDLAVAEQVLLDRGEINSLEETKEQTRG